MSNPEKIVLGNGLDGESYVGKSTAIETMKNIESLREKGIIIVPEYAVIGKFINFPRETNQDLKNAIKIIIDLEKKRTDILSDGLAKNKESVVLFDRSPISCIAFEHAAEKAGFKGAALWMAEAFQQALGDKKIIVPHGIIHLTASRQVIQKRRKKDLSNGNGEIIDFLKDTDVIKNINYAFNAFGDFLPKQLFLTLNTDNKSTEEVGAIVLQFITNQDESAENFIPDFVSYAEKLINKKI